MANTGALAEGVGQSAKALKRCGGASAEALSIRSINEAIQIAGRTFWQNEADTLRTGCPHHENCSTSSSNDYVSIKSHDLPRNRIAPSSYAVLGLESFTAGNTLQRYGAPMGIRMLTTIELAEILGMSPGTIANARVNGTLDIPFVKLNAKGVRYMESDVLAFIERRKVRSTAEADALNNAA